MKDKKEIEIEREELKRAFPLLFALEKKNPFAVPEQYFSKAEREIVMRTNLENSNAKDKTFEVPDNYFEDLESKLKARLKLEGLKKNTFDTPENYFEENEKDIARNVFLDELKSNSFSVPSDYFESSDQSLLTEIYLSAFKNHDVFSIPENYFDGVEGRVRDKLNIRREAKVIRMPGLSRPLKFVAAAAAIIGVCVMVWLLLADQRNQRTYLSAAEKKSIIENPELYGIDLNTIAELAEENPDLISAADEVPDNISEEALNEIVMDADVDINSIAE